MNTAGATDAFFRNIEEKDEMEPVMTITVKGK